MSFRLTALTPTIGAAPGERVLGRVEIHNDGSVPATYSVTVVGLDTGRLAEHATTDATRVSIDAGQVATLDIPIVVPASLGIGQHAAAFEVTSNRPGDRAVLTPFTLSIASIARVELVATPATIRARRRAQFHVDLTNNEPLQVDVALTGEAPDVEIEFTPSAFTLRPGERAVAKAKVRGPRHWAGESTQHNVLITARGRASSANITAAYVQRPLFAHRMRMVLAAVTVIALWLAAIGGVAFWLASRDDGTDATADGLIGVDTDGDGLVDVFFDSNNQPVSGKDTNGDGIPDSFVDADGNPISGLDTDGDGVPDKLVNRDGSPIVAVDTNGDGIPDSLSDGSFTDDEQATAGEPEPTILRGTISIDGDPSEVAVVLTPIALGATPEPATAPVGFRGAEPTQLDGKIWSTRYGVAAGPTSEVRRTVGIEPADTQPGVDGVWLFTDVMQGQSYELSFSKAGYQTQSFVVTPSADGEPIDLDVEMKAANGSLSGTVTGPSGPLGGADITVTDGTLEFKTTSDSNTGEWSIEGVSTPGVYTMSAVLRGYATAVRQVELSAGDDASGITLQMQPGLSTITGHIVDATGKPVGGVTVTASNGDTTLISTSLTQGDIGFYSLPQLAVPATYTVTATLDGYITQSRRVPVNGSVGGIDFTMTSETITLTGRVTSTNGKGIASAGLIISTGDLVFRSSTSAAPNPGYFSIDRLPPGTYTITVEHYQHENATEFVTLRAGETPAPLNIVLRPTTGPPAIGTGSLSVTVRDGDLKLADPWITPATVTLSRNRTTDVRTLTVTDKSGVTFEKLPIGTYTINVTAPTYNPSQPETRSIGMSADRIEIQLQKLGQASGTMVDSLTNAPLKDYFVTVYRVTGNNPQDLQLIDRYQSDADGKWETEPNQLRNGIYQVQIETGDQPTGYLVTGTQMLADAALVGGKPMRFVVSDANGATVETMEVPPIRADPYPTITGRVYKPTLDATNNVGFIALDDDDLTVSAKCNGQTVAVATHNRVAGPENDEFSIAKSEIARVMPPTYGAPAPSTTCALTVSAPNRVSVPITLTDVTPAANGKTGDRRVASALTRDLGALTGSVFWIDPKTSESVSLPGTSIVAETELVTPPQPSEVITGFLPKESAPTSLDTLPTWTTAPSSGTSGSGGAWTLNGQVFGRSVYRFTSPTAGTGRVQVRIDETGRTVTSDGGTAVTPDGNGYKVQLIPPNKGTVTGKVTINTNRSTPDYAHATVNAVDSLGNPRSTTPLGDGSFTFAGAEAGTWTVTFTTPPNHRLETPASGSVTDRVDAGTTKSGFDATFTELAAVEVELFDKFAAVYDTPITPAGATITLTDAAGNAVPDAQVVPVDDGVYRITHIPVDAATAISRQYYLEVDVPDYDMRRVRAGTADIDATRIPVALRAGDVASYQLGIAPFRTITSKLVGKTGGPDAPLQIGPGGTQAKLVVEPVNADGTPRTTTDPAPKVVSSADGTFTVTGAPGYYKLTPSHPEYGAAIFPSDPNQTAPPTPTAGVYLQLDNADTSLGEIELPILLGTLNLSAVTQLNGGTTVSGAVYDLTPGSGPCVGSPGGTVIPDAGAQITDLAPGNYCLAVNKFDATNAKVAFPAIYVVNIPKGVGGVGSITEIIAPLPPLQATLVGTLVGKNVAQTADVDLVSASAPQMQLVFDAPDIGLNGGTVPNAADNTATVDATKVTPSPGAIHWTYSFPKVGYGENTVTAPAITGYTLVNPTATVTVPTMGPVDVPDFVYTAATTDVAINIGSGVYPSLDNSLDDNGTAAALTFAVNGSTTQYSTYTFQPNTAGNILVIKNVAPDARGYTLSFKDALHADVVNVAVTVPLAINDVPNNRRTGTMATLPTADMVRLAGTAQQTDASGTTDLDAAATISLEQGGVTKYTTHPDNGAYFIDTVGGTYTLLASNDHYDPLQQPDLILTSLGTIVDRAQTHINLQKLARVQVRTQSGGLNNPAGFAVTMVRSDNTTKTPLTSVVANPEGSPSVPFGTYTFEVPTGNWTARAKGSVYPEQQSVATNLTVGAGWGADGAVKVNVALPRIAIINVSSPADTTVKIGAANPTASTSNLFTFTDGAGGLAATGALSATVSAGGYRTRTVAVPATIYSTPAAIALYGNVTVTGSIPGATAGSITAIDADNNTKTGTITGSGASATYGFTGLGVGVWTVTYTQDGVGSTNGAITIATITAESPTTATMTGNQIDLAPSDIGYSFTVRQQTGSTTFARLVGANIQLIDADGAVLTSGTTRAADAGPPVVAAGTAVLTLAETARPTTWRITDAGFLDQTGTITWTGAGQNIPVVTLQPAVKGTVKDGTTLTPATITICAGNVNTICAAADAQGTITTADGNVSYTGELANGSYTLFAVAGTKSGRTGPPAITIGTLPRSDFAIVVTDP